MSSTLRDRFRRTLNVQTIIFAPYILATVWEFFWAIPNTFVAWSVAVIVSLAIWCGYIWFKEEDHSLPRAFWLVVVPPLIAAYSVRAIFPDISFDVLNYHLFHSERALHAVMLTPQDFFPTPAPFNPAPDVLTGLYRHLLGYRLGTIVNLVTLIWVGAILDHFLRKQIVNPYVRAATLLVILCTEQVLFQINNYMVDLLALPLLLEATRLAVSRSNEARRRSLIVGLLLGISITFKLANLIFAAPIGLLLLFNLLADGQRRNESRTRLLAATFGSGLACLLPVLPYSIFLYRLTGNPFFPLYNAFFKSPYWLLSNVFDPRWGPKGLEETLLWPILIFFKPDRFCEFPVYSGRISIGFILALVCLILGRRDRMIAGLCVLDLLGCILWSATSGYSRYAIFLEIISGLIGVWLITFLWQASARLPAPIKWLAPIAVSLVLLAQVVLALNYSDQYEWSMRAPIYRHRLKLVAQESTNLLRDRSLPTYLSSSDQALLRDVDVWFETTYKTAGLEALLKPDIPAIGVRNGQYFLTDESRQRFDETVRALRGKRMFTLTDPPNLEDARHALGERGLTAGKIQAFSIPYFSHSLRLDMLLVEVLPNSGTTSQNR